MTGITSKGKAKRVGVLWLLILLAFIAFNAAYWPVHFRQRERDPANFLPYARTLHEAARTREAVAALQAGIAAHRPATAEPYRTLQARLSDLGDMDAARRLQEQILFYHGLETGGATGEALVRDAIMLSLESSPLPTPAQETARALRIAAVELGAAIGQLEAVRALNIEQQFALLRLAGGTVNTDGTIGKTGVKIPADLIVQSGGGHEGKRIAHILLRGRNYCDDERGFHVAIIDPVTGQVLNLGVFDVWQSASEAARMARLLRGAPHGAIGAFCVLDDASLNLTHELGEALVSFGMRREAIINRVPAFFGLRFSFAAIGVKGADAGTAMQAWSPANFGGQPGHPVACITLRPEGAAP